MIGVEKHEILVRLDYLFGCPFARYIIDSAKWTITCYTSEGIMWGKLHLSDSQPLYPWTIRSDVSTADTYGMYLDGLKIELFFCNYKHTIGESKKNFKIIQQHLCSIAKDDHEWFADNGIRFV